MDVPPDRARMVADELFASLMSVMTRLLGMEISRRIADELDTLIGREGRACGD
ncbi:MAG: hypothetical protein Q8P31_05750 [Bacillota bacterium]|nr:hypothetical protein [Bacillota bacterium]